MAAIEQPEYGDLTFGIISLLGGPSEQVREIETLLRNSLAPDEYERRHVLCGTPPQFQGDERDVVFLSVVDSSQDGKPLTLRQLDRDKKRYNVAASRARDQLWVVHSLDPARDLRPGDLRRRLIEFAQNPRGLKSALEHAQARAESPFEKAVVRDLVTAGYRVTSQYQVGSYRIDLVVGHGDKKLAVECDGDRFHTSANLQQDLERQAQLERMGWRFVRIRGSEYFRDTERALKPLYKRIAELGIEPDAEAFSQMPSSELIERVKRRASEIRAGWEDQSSGGAAKPNTGPAEVAHGGTHSTPVRDSARPDSARPLPSLRAAHPSESGPPVRATYPLPGLAPQASVSPIPDDGTREIIERFRAEGYRVEDNRSKQGALWIYDSEHTLESLMLGLRARGIRFTYSQKRSGWFMK